jgi:hypothetical protein
MEAKTKIDALKFAHPTAKKHRKVRDAFGLAMAEIIKTCSHLNQGETPDGEQGKRRICLTCGAEQESTSRYSWSPATAKFKKAGEYDDRDWHYTVDARLDLVKNPTVYAVTWDEVCALRGYFP